MAKKSVARVTLVRVESVPPFFFLVLSPRAPFLGALVLGISAFAEALEFALDLDSVSAALVLGILAIAGTDLKKCSTKPRLRNFKQCGRRWLSSSCGEVGRSRVSARVECCKQRPAARGPFLRQEHTWMRAEGLTKNGG
jgi:hypothetical protein